MYISLYYFTLLSYLLRLLCGGNSILISEQKGFHIVIVVECKKWLVLKK